MSLTDASAPAGDLALDRVTKRYGDMCACDRVSLDVRAGEFVTLLGPSGSGKTTTLRIVAGFVQPDEGVVALSGRDLTRLPPYKRDIGMVFQNYALFPHLSVRDNVAFPLKMRGVKRAERRSRAEAALQLVHLDGLGDRTPRKLSGGQQQRVALARAIVFDPRILLMDEPLGALDKHLREALQLEICALSRRLGITVVYVTHDQEEALAMSDRIAIYNSGRIEQVGSGEDLYERPRSLFVATFIGESNLLPGRLEVRGSSPSVVDGDRRLHVSPEAVAASGLGHGSSAHVVLRPERVTVRHEQPSSGSRGPNRLGGTLEQMVYLGATCKCVVQLDGQRGALQARVQARDAAELRIGGRVAIEWEIEDGIVVDAGGQEGGAGGREPAVDEPQHSSPPAAIA